MIVLSQRLGQRSFWASGSGKHTCQAEERLTLPLPFNADNRNINDLKVCVLRCYFADTRHIKMTELHFVNKYETNIPVLEIYISFPSTDIAFSSIKVKYYSSILPCIVFTVLLLRPSHLPPLW